MYQTEQIDTSKLKPFPIREIRPAIIERIKARIESTGYNPSRPLSVVKQNGSYIVADGNHRYEVIRRLQIESVPCVVYEEGHDPYSLAVNGNQDEDTYAPMDLFDWLDVIGRLQDEGLTQEKIGERIGWSREKVRNHVTLRSQIGTEILIFAKTFQEGRVPNFGTFEPKNERGVNTFDFTEGWFRNSGLYELTAENQMVFMKWFIEDQKSKVAPKKAQEVAAQLKEQQDQIRLVEDTLNNELDPTELIEAVKRGEYSTNRLMQVIGKLNDGAKSKAVYGVDSIQGIKGIPDASIDVVITDPPYGVDYVPSRKTDNPSFNDSDSVLGYIDNLCKDLKRVCKENAHLYFFSGCVNAFELKAVLGKHFKVYDNWLTWVKNNHTPCDFSARYASKYEVIWFCKMPKGDERKLNSAVSPDVLEYAVERDKAHDCQKPIELLKYLVNNSSALGETVLDPFCGSGSTLLAAKSLKRNYIGFEIEKSYEPGFKKKAGEIDALGG